MSTILTDDERPELPPTNTVPRDYFTTEQMGAYADAREAAVLAKLAQQVPVAWIRPSGKAMLEAGGSCTVYASDGMSTHSAPLYTHPAPQQADRRTAVCVSACEGLETAILEMVLEDGRTIKHDLDEFEAKAKDSQKENERLVGVLSNIRSFLASEIECGVFEKYVSPALDALNFSFEPQQADRQRVPGPTNNYHQLREALIFADQAMAESGLLACHAVRIQIRAALDNAAAPEALAIAYLEEIYEYLCSSAPIGVADEAFRLVPAEILSFETRDRISLQRKPKGALPREISRHDGPLTRGRAGDGGSVAAPEAPAQADRQRVPAEPTEAMLIAARDWSLKKYGKAIGDDAAKGCFSAMLAAAPEAPAEATGVFSEFNACMHRETCRAALAQKGGK